MSNAPENKPPQPGQAPAGAPRPAAPAGQQPVGRARGQPTARRGDEALAGRGEALHPGAGEFGDPTDRLAGFAFLRRHEAAEHDREPAVGVGDPAAVRCRPGQRPRTLLRAAMPAGAAPG